jgi:ribose 5-phosphate isomerase B
VRIAFGTDEATEVTEALLAHLGRAGHVVVDTAPGAAWPEVGRSVAEAVAADAADVGIVCCFTGTGVAIAANKVAGVRAALCTDAATAAGARRWNDANVLALGLRLTTAATATEIADAFVATGFDEDEADNVGRVESATSSRGGR